MDEQITLEQIESFKKIYNSNPQNKVIEYAITKNGLDNACINRDVIIENQPIFNIELPDSKRVNQCQSLKCWILAGLNFIKHNIAKNLNIDIMNLELSDNYISFFDKLEKSNSIYEKIISIEDYSYEHLYKENIVIFSTTEGGDWSYFVAIVNKYGILPYSYNPNVVDGLDYEKINALYTEKVKKDIIKLIDLREKGTDKKTLRNIKNEFLAENYTFLSKILGEPLTTFNYEYRDKDGEYKRIENISPIDFKNKFLSINLNDFIEIGNLPMYNKEYYKLYRKKYLENVYTHSYIDFLNLPIEDLKELVIKQLQDGLPVFMGGHFYKCRDKSSGVLDTRLYNYKESLNFNPLTKQEALNLYDIDRHHRITFVGVNIVNGKPQRWKLEDNYGEKTRYNGYYIMNDNFFNEFVLSIVIDKKYLSDDKQKLLLQEPIDIDVTDVF